MSPFTRDEAEADSREAIYRALCNALDDHGSPATILEQHALALAVGALELRAIRQLLEREQKFKWAQKP